MLASQLIYTACGRGRNGAYSVWSKSADITTEDSDVIVNMMNYERPAHLPRIPTEEERKTLFPKKTAFFKLPSGKYCIAQSAYIGRVYSDEDDRTGNFIIHAFVFDNPDKIRPMLYMGSEIFKDCLTYEEWHENDAPETLPAIELRDGADLLSDADVAAFFQEARWETFARLLQATVNAQNSAESVTFHDSDANLRYWYKALSACLPLSMQKSMTYCSNYAPMNAYGALPGVGGPLTAEVKLRNVIPDSDNLYFSYEQELRKGKYVFDFENGIESSTVAVSKYVSSIVALLRKGTDLAMAAADAVDRLMSTFGCTPDEAMELYRLEKWDVEWFQGDWARIAVLARQMQKRMPDAFSQVADGLYDYFFVSPAPTSGSSRDLLELYRMIFDYSEKADKGVIVGYYLDHQYDLGVKESGDSAAYVKDVRAKAPFMWVNFIDYIYEKDHLSEYLHRNIDSFPALYLLYVSLIEAWGELNKNRKEVAQKYFLRLTARAIRAESAEEFNVLLSTIQKCGEKWETWLVKNALLSLMDDSGKVTDACSGEFLLSLTKQLSKGELALIILEQLISENMTDSFARLYVKETAEMQEKFAQYEKNLREDEDFAQFFDRVQIFRFELLSDVTKSDLARFYRDVYCKEQNESIEAMFLAKVDAYLNQYGGAEWIREFTAIYSDWIHTIPEDRESVNSWIAQKTDAIFRMDMRILIAYAGEKGFGALDPILGRLHGTKRPVPVTYFILRRGLEARAVATAAPELRKVRVTKAEITERLEQDAFYSRIQQEESLDLFMHYFMTDLVLLYLKLWSTKTFEQRFEACFAMPAKSRHFEQYLLDSLEKLEKQDYVVLLTALFSYAYARQNALAKTLRGVIERYLESVGRGKRKKIFAMVRDNVLPDYGKSVLCFIEEYRKNDLSFFDKLFGGTGGIFEEEDEKDSKKNKSDKK